MNRPARPDAANPGSPHAGRRQARTWVARARWACAVARRMPATRRFPGLGWLVLAGWLG